MNQKELIASLKDMFGGLPPEFAEAWGAEPAAIIHGLLYRRPPDAPTKRAIDEAWAGWCAFHRERRLTVAESNAKLDALEWALRLNDAGRLTKATGLSCSNTNHSD